MRSADDGEPIDLIGVHPMRRDQIRLRIEAVRRWLASERRDPEEEKRIAAGLGIGVPMFRVLVRAWIVHGRAADMPGASIGGASPRRMPAADRREADPIIDEVIRSLGPGSRPVEIMNEVRARCIGVGLLVPGIDRVTTRLYRARESTRTAAASRLFVDHCALRLPVIVSGRILAPVATMCFDDVGHFYSWKLAFTGPTAQVAAATLAEALAAAPPGGEPTVLVMGVGRTPGWDRVVDALSDASVGCELTRGVPVPSGRRLREVFGRAIGGLRLMPNLTHSDRSPRFAAATGSAPLSMSEAEDAVADAVRLSNAQRGGGACRPRISSDADEADLKAALSRIAEERFEPPRRRR